MVINCCAYIFKTFINIAICETEHVQTEAFKICCTRTIMNASFCCIMLRTVKFNNQLCAAAIEIDNISRELFLPPELDRMLFQMIIPQPIFLRRSLPAQLLRL